MGSKLILQRDYLGRGGLGDGGKGGGGGKGLGEGDGDGAAKSNRGQTYAWIRTA